MESVKVIYSTGPSFTTTMDDDQLLVLAKFLRIVDTRYDTNDEKMFDLLGWLRTVTEWAEKEARK